MRWKQSAAVIAQWCCDCRRRKSAWSNRLRTFPAFNIRRATVKRRVKAMTYRSTLHREPGYLLEYLRRVLRGRPTTFDAGCSKPCSPESTPYGVERITAWPRGETPDRMARTLAQMLPAQNLEVLRRRRQVQGRSQRPRVRRAALGNGALAIRHRARGRPNRHHVSEVPADGCGRCPKQLTEMVDLTPAGGEGLLDLVAGRSGEAYSNWLDECGERFNERWPKWPPGPVPWATRTRSTTNSRTPPSCSMPPTSPISATQAVDEVRLRDQQEDPRPPQEHSLARGSGRSCAAARRTSPTVTERDSTAIAADERHDGLHRLAVRPAIHPGTHKAKHRTTRGSTDHGEDPSPRCRPVRSSSSSDSGRRSSTGTRRSRAYFRTERASNGRQ